MAEQQEHLTNKPSEGLHQDNSFADQPKGSPRFALNSVIESHEGNFNFRTVEEGNQACDNFPAGYTPMGRVYIGNGQIAVLLGKDDGSASEIGIIDTDCNYVTHVNDEGQVEKLNFYLNAQIDVTYRLRRGCERTIYFVQKGNYPRYYNFDNPDDFKTGGLWKPDKFKLFKTSGSAPTFDNIEILETGGIPSGSYNFAVQYLDEDLNPTAWITTTDTVTIYNDSPTSKSFSEVRGSTNRVNFYQDFGATNKAVKLTLGNLNTDFPFYRIGVIESNNGSGLVSRVIFSAEISTVIKVYTYTGQNVYLEGTEEEILQFSNAIESAESIEQIENRLILGKLKGKQVNWCGLQKYASRITADIVYEEVVLNNLDIPNNPKRAQLHNEKVGYMPGEIYSFGVVWVFDDGYISPAYHIPGRADTFSSGMSKDNKLTDAFYTNTNCGTEDYWGTDSQGVPLSGKQIRHHRFPLRSEANKPLYTTIDGGLAGVETEYYTLYIDIYNTVLGATLTQAVSYQITYEIDSVQYTVTRSVNNVGPDGVQDVFIATSLLVITYIGVEEIEDGIPGPIYSGLSYTPDYKTGSSITQDSEYRSEIFGIQFSNIDIPTAEAIGGETIVGYYIVRNERGEDDKTILDTAVLAPMLVEKVKAGNADKFIAHGLLAPNTATVPRTKDDMVALIHPEHKFNNREYKNTTEFIQEGEYVVSSTNYNSVIVQDVMPGTSYDSSVNKRRERDSDGFSLHNYIRNSNVSYVPTTDSFAEQADISDIFYLDALFSKTVTDVNSDRKEVFNISCDNKIGILQLNRVFPLTKFGPTSGVTTKFPYVVMKRNLGSSYSGFRVLPYHKEHVNIESVSGLTDNVSNPIFNGDSYIGSMTYVSSIFHAIKLRERDTKSGFWNYVAGALLIVVGGIAAIFTAGASVALIGAGVAAIGAGIALVSSGLKVDQLGRVFRDLYELGLKDTADDDNTATEFGGNPSDDEVQWTQDSITRLWFETGVNINWRMGTTTGITDFLNSPIAYSDAVFESYSIEKVTDLDPEADGGRTSLMYAKAEIYEVNDDYKRRDRQKLFYHLGLEYDCCSDCVEDFPGRFHWSEQSFQEELTDNYRIFLPNNYRDIEGESGVIFNIFRIQNNLYIHTEEALWHLPQTIQERVTGEIISFIGTGEFFSIPPRKIVDDDTGHSAGIRHKWSSTKTPYGVFFVCENQHTIFQFDGSKMTPISANGLFNYFKNNIQVAVDRAYYITNRRAYPFRDNPSNKFGSGFISTYDSRKERIIFTKKDLRFTEAIITGSTDYELCVNDNQLTVFEDYQATIATQAGLGWEFIGIQNGILDYQLIKAADGLVVTTLASYQPTVGLVIENFKGTISTAEGLFKLSGSPDHDIVAKIYAVNISNEPTTLLETSATIINTSSLIGTLFWYSFDFTGSYDESIAIVFEVANVVLSDGSNNVEYGLDNTPEAGFEHVVNIGTIGSPNWFLPGSVGSMRLNYTLEGGCKMKFQRLTTELIEIEEEVTIPNNADVVIQLDMSGSFSPAAREEIRISALTWYSATPVTLPDWGGNMYFQEYLPEGGSETYLLGLKYALTYDQLYTREIGVNTEDNDGTPVTEGLSTDIILVSFVNEASPAYHGSFIQTSIPSPGGNYAPDLSDFTFRRLGLLTQGGSFKGLLYPIVMTSGATAQWADTEAFLQHALGALKGVPYTSAEVSVINSQINPFVAGTGWSVLMSSLTGTNPYPDAGLESLGWKGIYNRGWNGTGVVITPEQFTTDINAFLEGTSTTETVVVQVSTLEYKYIDGTTLPTPTTYNASWTMSHSLKKNSWTSWHSYFPNMYMHTPDTFYSWINANSGIYKHNIKGLYQTYYGVKHPFIVEYVSVKSPLITGIWDYIRLITEAQKYDSLTDEYRELRFATFNKAIFYNSRQCSGEVTLIPKDTQANPENYLSQQVVNAGNNIAIIDKNEKDWTINDLRDIRIDYDNTIWDASLGSVQSEYFIDKVLKTSTLDVNKSIYELESFRDKYLVIRLIFDTFDDVKLTVNYTVENEIQSYR